MPGELKPVFGPAILVCDYHLDGQVLPAGTQIWVLETNDDERLCCLKNHPDIKPEQTFSVIPSQITA